MQSFEYDKDMILNIDKSYASCPFAEITIRELSEEDWNSFSCELLTLDRKLVMELPKCSVAD